MYCIVCNVFHSNEPEVLMKHIEKLLSRVNKIELIAQILLSNAGEVIFILDNKYV